MHNHAIIYAYKKRKKALIKSDSAIESAFL